MKFSSVFSIQIFSVKNANPSSYEIHVENDYFPLPFKFEKLSCSFNDVLIPILEHYFILRSSVGPLNGGMLRYDIMCCRTFFIPPNCFFKIVSTIISKLRLRDDWYRMLVLVGEDSSIPLDLLLCFILPLHRRSSASISLRMGLLSKSIA